MPTTWILVADRLRARLFSFAGDARQAEEIGDFINTRGEVRGRTRQRPPRSHDRFGPGRHAIEPHTSPEERSIACFVAELGAVLERGRVGNRYQHLVLIAPPRFLGALKASLNKHVQSRVVSGVPKDLTGAGMPAICAQLPPSLRREDASAAG